MNAKRRLTLVIPSLAAGGAERVLSLLANEWVRRGDEVVLITLAPADEDFFEVDDRVKRIGLDLASRPRGIDWLRVNAARIGRLRRVVRASQPDVVLSFLDAANLLTLIATRGMPVPVVISQRTDPALHPIKHSHRVLRRHLYRRASAVVVQTEVVGAWASTLVPRERVVAIPNPVESVDAAPSLARRPIVAAVGRLDRQKGFDLLIDAFARCADAYPEWSIVIAGAGPELAHLVEQATQANLQDRVEFRGLISDPHRLFAESSLFVLPSRSEGFPNVVLEAMAGGVPVVACDCSPGVRELIRHDLDGVLVPADDAESLAGAIRRLLADDQERRRLATAATGAVRRFELPAIAERWDALFDRVTEGARVATKGPSTAPAEP